MKKQIQESDVSPGEPVGSENTPIIHHGEDQALTHIAGTARFPQTKKLDRFSQHLPRLAQRQHSVISKQEKRLGFETLAATLKNKIKLKNRNRHGMIPLHATSRLANREREKTDRGLLWPRRPRDMASWHGVSLRGGVKFWNQTQPHNCRYGPRTIEVFSGCMDYLLRRSTGPISRVT